jgi:hypothetical protein
MSKQIEQDNIIRKHYDSIHEFYQDVTWEWAQGNNSPSRSDRINDPARWEWVGANKNEIQARKWGWADGIKMLDKLPELSAPVCKSARRYVWDEEDGDEMSVDRYESDMPFLRKRVLDVSGKKRGGNAYRIISHIGENCGRSSSEMIWKAYAAARACDTLEAQGHSVRFEIGAYQTRATSLSRREEQDVLITCTVKQEGEAVNLPLLLNVCSPWFFRAWMFGAEDLAAQRAGTHMNSGYGQTRALPRLVTENAFVIQCDEVLSEEAVKYWLEKNKIR